MRERRKIFFIMFLCMVILDTLLIYHIKESAGSLVRLDEAAVMDTLRNQQIPSEVQEQLAGYAEEDGEYSYYEFLFGYLYSGLTEKSELTHILQKLKAQYPSEYTRFTEYERAVWSEIEVFPVPLSALDAEESVNYSDSWMQSRTYGGDRGHEGCDVMASINIRGHYPIVSVSDGVIEKIGWLPQGGYRIGIRSTSGAYLYYAHLYDYAKEFEIGEEVRAGELLGFMGDSGYSDIEGTVGNFDVHLHFGIYLNDENGEEFSVNSYWILTYLENKKISYYY